jgi:hypothetical protein
MNFLIDLISTLLLTCLVAIGVAYVVLLIWLFKDTNIYKKFSAKPGCQTSGDFPAAKTTSQVKSATKRLSKFKQRCAAPWD